MEEYIKILNEKQKEAVLCTDGPLLIIAGAGSGKTKVLTTRIAHLVKNGVEANRILALTFTRKAAQEMKSRVEVMTKGLNGEPVMGTFHSIFASLLRFNIYKLGLSGNFTILDEEDSKNTLKKCIQRIVVPNLEIDKQITKEDKDRYKSILAKYDTKLISSRISNLKNNLSLPNDIDETTYPDTPLLPKIYELYMSACKISNCVDFDDILLFTDILLHNDEELCRKIACYFKYILIDEYQDTNVAQYSILRRLTKFNRNICVVGDDSQSIYAFRGAKIQNIFNFKQDFPEAKMIRLEQNYRSTKTIVDAANRLISHNNDRIPKTCYSMGEQGNDIIRHDCRDETTEGLYVANIIKNKVRYDGMKYSDFAILYRTNSQSRAIESGLLQKQIPYVVYSGTSFFERKEVKDQLAYFKLAVNPDDNEAFLRVINKPARGIGPAAQNKLEQIASESNLSLWKVIDDLSIMVQNGLSKKALDGIVSFKKQVESYMDAAESMTAYDAAYMIYKSCGIYEEYRNLCSAEDIERLANLKEVINSVASYQNEKNNEKKTLTDYIQNISLLSDVDIQDSTDKVSIMTVHAAKGLEFHTVFVTGMEQTLFPLEFEHNLIQTEEERRLFYVAVTRAEKQLYITKVAMRRIMGKVKKRKPSVFLKEL